jgi:hypothetical protein
VLFKAWLVKADDGANLAFDERLAHGEDTDFFHRAAKCGASIVYSHEPTVIETVPPERATLSYQTRRAYHYAASRSYFHRRCRGWSGAAPKLATRWLVHAPSAVARLVAAPLVWPFSEVTCKQLTLKGVLRLAAVLGASAGLLGFNGNPYRTIDGY